MLKTNTTHNSSNNAISSRSHNYTNANNYNDNNHINNIMNGDNARNNNIIITPFPSKTTEHTTSITNLCDWRQIEVDFNLKSIGGRFEVDFKLTSNLFQLKPK